MIFGKISETVEENVLYVRNHVYLAKYYYDRTLKTSDISTVQQTNNDPVFDTNTRAIK